MTRSRLPSPSQHSPLQATHCRAARLFRQQGVVNFFSVTRTLLCGRVSRCELRFLRSTWGTFCRAPLGSSTGCEGISEKNWLRRFSPSFLGVFTPRTEIAALPVRSKPLLAARPWRQVSPQRRNSFFGRRRELLEWSRWDSNPRPSACKADALPIELRPQVACPELRTVPIRQVPEFPR